MGFSSGKAFGPVARSISAARAADLTDRRIDRQLCRHLLGGQRVPGAADRRLIAGCLRTQSQFYWPFLCWTSGLECCVALERAGHAVGATPTAAQLEPFDGDDLDPGFAQSRVCARV